MNTVDNIMELIKINGIDQKEFAKNIGVTPSMVSEWRNRKT